MKKIVIATLVAVSGFVGLCVVAGRNLGEMTGYFRASADTVVEALPSEVHDRKLEHDIRRARQEVIDRQVQLNLSRSHLDQLQADAEELSASTSRRERLLADAYPALKIAAEANTATIRFASTE
ncbi:MAG: hypothetical protein CMJ64_10875 [Planctomycetaceae bacterium]|jgi:hypothetical protein|nr:hypothetical protein [Planctomycetaceae bacterium]|tara:strand:+ start:74 stop:445 length:372 start_codon:yes stop_codon:yes gene_type:complete